MKIEGPIQKITNLKHYFSRPVKYSGTLEEINKFAKSKLYSKNTQLLHKNATSIKIGKYNNPWFITFSDGSSEIWKKSTKSDVFSNVTEYSQYGLVRKYDKDGNMLKSLRIPKIFSKALHNFIKK